MDALHGRKLNVWRKSLTATTQKCCEQYWTSPRCSTPQSSSCKATYHPWQKISKLDEPNMRDTAGEVGTKRRTPKDPLTWTSKSWTTPSHGWANGGRPARTYIQQLCADTGCSLEDLPGVMDYKDGWRDRVREIHADFSRWWWLWWLTFK